jgi:hypothetical protein
MDEFWKCINTGIEELAATVYLIVRTMFIGLAAIGLYLLIQQRTAQPLAQVTPPTSIYLDSMEIIPPGAKNRK